MPISYAKAVGLEIKPLSLITDKHVTMSFAAGQYSEAVGCKVPFLAIVPRSLFLLGLCINIYIA